MKYILDSNVTLKWSLPEPDSAKAIRLRDNYQNGVHELLSPDVFPVEVAHALTRAERQGRIAVSESGTRLVDILSNAPQLFPYFPHLGRATEISSQMRVGVYDCLYVAMAESEGCELVTADDKLIKNLQGRFPFIKSLASMP
jgi:predicted nucleic acid-binding protein